MNTLTSMGIMALKRGYTNFNHMPYTIERYKKSSNLSYIINYTLQVESFATAHLDYNDPEEQRLLNQIKRNTNSISKLVYKHLNKLQARQLS